MTEGAAHERSLAEPAFPGDDGSIDPALEAAAGQPNQMLAAFGTARVFVPVVAILGERATDGSDKNAEMAAVMITSSAGRTALLTFTSVAAMAVWDPQARPVPVYGRDAARAALADECGAMLLDLGSAAMQVIDTDDMQHIADEHVLVQTPDGRTAWVAPA
jgi:biotin synthase-related radical SAM superfamily protein